VKKRITKVIVVSVHFENFYSQKVTFEMTLCAIFDSYARINEIKQ